MANVSSSNGIEKYPKLRFPEFTEPWRDIKLSDVSSYRNKRTTVSKVKYVSTENMLQNYAGLEPYTEDIETDGIAIFCNDTLLANIRPYLKKVLKSEFNGACSTDVLAFSPEQINPDFLYSLIAQDKFIDYVMSGAKGSKMPRGDKSHIMDYATSIPTEEEQQKISSFVELINNRIAAQTYYIELLKKYKRGLNIRLLSGISMSYSKRLGDVCSIIGGGTPDTTTAKFWDGGINWFTPSEIGKTKYVVSSVRSISYDGMLKSSAKLLPQNTVLLTTRATLGEMSILHAEATTNQGFQSLIPSNELLAEYVYYLQVIIKPWCEKYASGNTFREISKSALSNCVIPVPDISIQNKIVRVLSGIDQHIERENDILDKLREQKKALLQQLFI